MKILEAYILLFKKLIEDLKHIKHLWDMFFIWLKYKMGKKVVALREQSYYYFTVGQILERPLLGKEGRIGIYEVIARELTAYSNKTYVLHLIGYKNCKPLKDCNFYEFVNYGISQKSN